MDAAGNAGGMKMSYPSAWKGNRETAEGVTTFMVDGDAYVIPLEKFSDALAIAKMLDKAFQMGRDSAKSVLLAKIEGTIHTFKRDFK